jgi:hypothetical protein
MRKAPKPARSDITLSKAPPSCMRLASKRTLVQLSLQCCRESCLASFCSSDQEWYCRRFESVDTTCTVHRTRQAHVLYDAGTHTSRLTDPTLPEQLTPLQLLSHGSLPVLWFCQPELPPLLHVLPLVAMYSSTSAARWAAAVGATTPTRTPHLDTPCQCTTTPRRVSMKAGRRV